MPVEVWAVQNQSKARRETHSACIEFVVDCWRRRTCERAGRFRVDRQRRLRAPAAERGEMELWQRKLGGHSSLNLFGNLAFKPLGVVVLVYTSLAAAIVAVPVSMNMNGFCWSRLRFTTEQEFIDIAIADEIDWVNGRASQGTGWQPGERFLPVQSASQFKSLNPNCCKILRGKDDSWSPYGFIDRALGYCGAVVQVTYSLFFVNSKGQQEQRPTVAFIPVASCGEIYLQQRRADYLYGVTFHP